ncbi:MAG TPA: phosphonate C-P lyase system protein PhnH [Xanthobacteraceae bacterium]|nr:phosphonate C-P lyase system protein PhnH [Xanthobacteraceae bacterium]
MNAPAAGFTDPVFDAQAAFRAAMWAMARPGEVRVLSALPLPPAPLSATAAALALALADYETPLWLDPALAGAPDVAAYLRFHTGAPIAAAPATARFALIADPAAMPPLASFAQGEPDYPDRSVTLILQVRGFAPAGLNLEGPGVEGRRRFGAAPLPAGLTGWLRANRALYPRGVDLFLAGPGGIAALPRSTVVTED